jgi:carbohydrate-selective porin OprB
MIIQGTNNVNNAASDVQKKKSRTDGSYSADITLAKEFKEINGRAFLHLEGGQGDGLEDNLTLYSNVNRDADNEDRVHLTEVWYEQGLFKDKAAITFGKLDPTAYFDQSEVANDETTQFLGRIFRNSPTVEFPDNTAGIRFAYMPKEWLELGYGVFDGKSSWEKIGDNLFNVGQVHLKTNFFNLPGNYRFYGWNNNVYHTKWLDTEKTKEAAYGFGLSFDQKVADIVTLFTRYGWQNPEVYNPEITATGDDSDPKYYSLEHSWSAGLQVEGKPWGREKDMLAFAVGQIFPSDDYKKAGESLDPARRAKAEDHLEAYYRIHVNYHLSISPNFQYIWNPFGKDVADDTSGIFVGGMRAQVDF